MDKNIAVVMGRNYTSRLGMIRAAGEAGCDVVVVRTMKRSKKIRNLRELDSKSKYVKKYLIAYEPEPQYLIDLLNNEFSSVTAPIILLPTDDYTASTIDLYQEQLNDNFLFPNVNHESGAVVHLMDKDIQKGLARASGLNVAEGWVAEIQNGAYTIPDGIRYPVFTKPKVSFSGNKNCMKRCNNQHELEVVLKGVASQRDCPILIEQYIEIEKEYGVLGYCDTQRVVIPCLVDKVEIGSGKHKGVTMIGEVHPMEELGELAERLKRFLSNTGFVGLIDIDLYESNGVIYFSELNLRLGAFGYAAMCAGINMPQMLIETLLGHDFPNVKIKMDHTVRCISEKVCLEDYTDGFVERKIYKKRLKMAEYSFIKSNRDPAPYRYFVLEEGKMLIKRLLK